MNRSIRLLSVLVMLWMGLASAQTAEQSGNSKDQLFASSMVSGATLRVNLLDGDYRIVGGDTDKLTVTAEGKNVALARRLKLEVVRNGDNVDLTLAHLPKNELQVTIAIPRNMDLYARMRGGDLAVEGVVGNKDLSLTGGDLTVGVGNPEGVIVFLVLLLVLPLSP